jgi:hypothetical protein
MNRGVALSGMNRVSVANVGHGHVGRIGEGMYVPLYLLRLIACAGCSVSDGLEILQGSPFCLFCTDWSVEIKV